MSAGRWRLPRGWTWAPAGELGEIVGGGTPPTSVDAYFAPRGIPWLTPADLAKDKSEFVARGARDITQAGLENSGARLLPKGAVLFSSRAPIGYCAIAANEIATNQGFKSLVLPSDVDGRFVRHYLLSARAYAESLASGTTFKELSGSKMAELQIPVAPKNEQRRIVAKLDELQAKSRRAKDALDAVPTLLEKFRQSVLAAAFRGDLTADWRAKNPDVEPASKLLERIRAERRRRWEEAELEKMRAKGKVPSDGRWKLKYIEPEPLDAARLPKLPPHWEWAALELLTSKIVDGVHHKPDYVDSGVPFITVRNLTEGKGLSFAETKFVSRNDHEEFIRRANPQRGDLLISKDGTLGVVRAIRTDIEFSIFVSVALMKPIDYALTDYLEAALSSWPVQKQIGGGTGTGLMHIHLTDLRRFAIPMAPVAEHQVLLSETARGLSAIDRLESSVREARLRCDVLESGILATAFRGELVPQDPNDEPADLMLERIRKEREAAAAAEAPAPKKPGRGKRKAA